MCHSFHKKSHQRMSDWSPFRRPRMAVREQKLREIEKIAAAIKELAAPGMSPKELIDAVRKLFPDATKKEVARAAFLSVIHSVEHDPDYTQELHDLAMETRDS